MNKKLYRCDKCGREVAVRSHGLCPLCRAKELKTQKKAQTRKTAANHKKNTGYSGFFNEMLEKLEGFRMSYTGRPIARPTVANVCHILPKRTYKSVAEDEENIIFLTLEEHTRFDRLLDSLEFGTIEKEFPMVWLRVLRQVASMLGKGKITEHGKILDTMIEQYDFFNNKNGQYGRKHHDKRTN